MMCCCCCWLYAERELDVEKRVKALLRQEGYANAKPAADEVGM